MPSSRRTRIGSFLYELRRRRVFRVAGIYVVAVFAALQGAEILVPALHLPAWTMTLLVLLALAGSPVVVALAWVFDIVPGGVQRTRNDRDYVATGPPPVPGARQVAAAQEAPPAPGAGLPGGAVLATPRADSATSLASEPSVAVVPFLNLSPDPDNEYFADGITEDVIAHLSRIGALKVISRASVMPFKKRSQSLREIGHQLGVRTLLDGSVRRAGDRVRIVAKLVDAETDQQLWADTYDRDLTDIFAIQTDVALHIAAALRAELSLDEQTRIRKEPTANLEAYHLYLKGRQLFIRYSPDSLHRAIDYYRRALVEDPAYTLAYVGIAMGYAELAEFGAIPAEVARRHASEAAAEALRLDPTLGEAHCTVAHQKSLWEFDWQGAEAAFRRALELCPNGADTYDLYGRMCAALGRFDEALVLQRRAEELDPLAHQLDVATTLLRAGRYPEAEAQALRALDFQPDYDRAHATVGWAYFKQGRTEDGIAELERAVALSDGATQWRAQLGQALALAGRADDARVILSELEHPATGAVVTPYHLAFVYAGLGEQERALDLLERAFDERAGAIYAIKGSFLLAPLRPHPRFKALLARMNIA